MDFRIAPMAAHGPRRRVRVVGRTTRRRIDAAGTLEAGGRAPPAFFGEDRRIDRTGNVPMKRTRTKMSRGASSTDRATESAGSADPSPLRGESKMVNVHVIDNLAERLAALVPPGLREAREDLTANFRSALQSGLRELDLVTREEFDVQRCVLLRTREKIEELEVQVASLERSIGAPPPRAPH